MTAVPHDPADPQAPASASACLQRGETRWRRLPDGGVECTWRSPYNLMWGSVTMLVFFLGADAVALFWIAKGAGIVGALLLVFYSYFTLQFARVTVLNVRAGDLPSRLVATPKGGLSYWSRTSERPQHIPRATIADVRVEGVARLRWWGRGWRLVVEVRNRRRAHVLFRADSRSELERTRRALADGLSLGGA